MYRILIVDDENWSRSGLRSNIERLDLPFEAGGEAENG
jgi:YesN/AraC family two-component response regulator